MAKKNPGLDAAQAIKQLQQKLTKIAELRTKINGAKTLYQEHDALVEELLPLFIEVQDDRFIIHRHIKLGSKTYHFSPYFYDEKKAQLVAKVWKSTAFGVSTID
jgi:hypothetical protein